LTTTVTRARNINEAFHKFKHLARNPTMWRTISPRGMTTMEWKSPVITEYTSPMERVLFSEARDANPFFHFFESLWILDGRKDVAFLAKFLPRIKDFSDDGETFHAPYGHRLRFHFANNRMSRTVDQIKDAISLLRGDPDTRRAVMTIWDPAEDLNVQSKDLPCNDAVFLKVRDGALEMSVLCRSNDVLLGAYGANVVQFSVLQEFIARAAGVKIGVYRQLSDSFHVYSDSPVWARVQNEHDTVDPYSSGTVWPFPLMDSRTNYEDWLVQLSMCLRGELVGYDGRLDPFFVNVAAPLLKAWEVWKDEEGTPAKNDRVDWAQHFISKNVQHCDWAVACTQWLDRRRERA
jgi:thymidylate synthase